MDLLNVIVTVVEVAGIGQRAWHYCERAAAKRCQQKMQQDLIHFGSYMILGIGAGMVASALLRAMKQS